MFPIGACQTSWHRQWLKRLIRPIGGFVIRVGKTTLPDSVLGAMSGFIAIFSACFALTLLEQAVDGLGVHSALAAAAG